MNQTISFIDVLAFAEYSTSMKRGNIKCPFCEKWSFKIYQDEKAKCHNNLCNWYGDAVQFYTDYKNITRDTAYKELAAGLDLKKSIVEVKEQTYEEARNALASDYEFLAWCRIYFAFYGDKVVDQKIYAEKCELSKSAFSKIINGNMGNAFTWRKTLNILRQEIDIDRLKKDIKKGAKYFIEDLPPEYIKKYRIEKKKK